MRYEDLFKSKSGEPLSKAAKYPVSRGKTIEEPETELTFTVVEDDVVGSVVADKEECAAAKALCRLPDIEHAWVFRSRTLVMRSSGVLERYQNPSSLAKAVDGFDNSAGLFPAGEYKLEPLRPSARRAAKKAWNEANKNRNGGKRPYAYAVTSPKPLRKK